MGVEGGRATDYIIRLARNVKRGREEKLRRGEWPGGQKTVGYIYDHRLRNIVPDPKKAKVVKTLFEEFVTGRYGLLACGQRLAELGVTTKKGTAFSKSAVRNVLTNRLYTGLMIWNGGIYEGKFKPIISVELFKRAQQMLKVKSKPRRVRKGHQFPFCGLFRCSCGSMVTAQWANGHGGVYRYYRCTRKSGVCDERYLQEQDLAKQCLETLQPFALFPQEASEIRSLIDETAENESASLAKSIELTEDLLTPLDEKLRKLTRGFLDDRIDEDSYHSLTEEIKMEKTRLKQEKQRIQKSRTNCWI
jgi:site-specific DNA recombinase